MTNKFKEMRKGVVAFIALTLCITGCGGAASNKAQTAETAPAEDKQKVVVMKSVI